MERKGVMGIEVGGRWRSTGLSKIKFKNERKRRHGRYLLNAAREYAIAAKRKDGSSGAASEVRHLYSRDRDGPK
jgi:hypothetical protein